MLKCNLLGSSTLRSAAAIAALISPLASAYAQDTEETPAVLQDTEATQEAEGEVLVTGSRIRRNETTSASPLQIIDPVIAMREGRFDTAEIVQNSPIASGSTQITAAISANTVSNGGPGAQTVSLRGLGAARTLVLLNSRRAGPAGTRGGVSAFDLNVLPSSVIRSVEILKDGASSIYGSDAIAGVVNLLTKTSTNGLEISGFSSVPIEGGGENYNINAAWGKDFGRGHILLAADYFRQNELERQDRSFLGCSEDYVFRPASTSGPVGSWVPGSTRADTIDPRTGAYACTNGVAWGHVWAYRGGGGASGTVGSNLPNVSYRDAAQYQLMQFSYGNDNLGRYVNPLAPPVNPGNIVAPAGWYPVGQPSPVPYSLVNSYHPFEQKDSIVPGQERISFYLDGAYEVFEGIEVYAEGIFNRRRTYIDAQSQIYNFGYTDMYAPGDPDDPFPGWTANGGFAYLSPTGILDDYDQDITVDYYRGVVGFRGEIDGNWRFDVYGQYSRSDGKYQLDQILKDAVDQQTNRAFGAGCAGLTTSISRRPCLQVNWVDPRFMAGDLTPAEKAYFLDTETGRTIYTQQFIEGSLSGNLFELPGGPVGVAVGGVYRRDEIDDTPGHITMAPNPLYNPARDPNNLQYNAALGPPSTRTPTVDNAFSNNFSSGHTFGYSITKEIFGELNLPLLKDIPFIQEFTVSGAARITNVYAEKGVDPGFRRDPRFVYEDNSTGNWTYKGMANWQINDWVRLRGTYGTSYRAPALFEQFLASQVSGASQNIDPCTNWGQGLASGAISQRVADNCASQGIGPNKGGAGIQVAVLTSGGLGQLVPETSTAWTASVILTPKFNFLPDTDIAITVDYFDINVQGEVQLFNNADILLGCYDSPNFPNDPRCSLFERGQDGAPQNLKTLRRQYVNIDEQINRGFDFTVRLRQDLGSLGRLSILGQATLQTKDLINRVGEIDDDNGDIGDPKFTGSLSTTWESGGTSINWGMNVIGKTSSVEDYLEANGALCNISPDRGVDQYGGNYCVAPFIDKTYFYHSLSLTQQVGKQFEMTLGVSNLFDTKPPQASGLALFVGNVQLAASQYDWMGRRAFVSAKARF
jgi:iron complex outermembrane receptor protein